MSRAAALLVLAGAGVGLVLAARFAMRGGGAGGWNETPVDFAYAPESGGDSGLGGLDFSPYFWPSETSAPYVGDLPTAEDTYTASAPAEEYTVARQGGGGLETAAGGLVDSLVTVAYWGRGVLFGMTYRTSAGGIERIKMHEGFRADVYLDQAGKPTIGYGHLIRAGESFPAAITEARARELLAADLGSAEAAVNALVTVRITQAQFDALVSFVFNVGTEAFRTSTLRRLLNAGDYAGAADQFKRWNKVRIGGQIVASEGLSNRRADEAAQFTQGVFV